MKKKMTVLLILFGLFITGCGLNNTPNSKVEELLAKYQSLDESIVITPNSLVNGNNLNDDMQNKYRKIIEKQYKNMTYEIKETKEDGNTATVTTEIEVTDFKSIQDKYNLSNYQEDEYNRLLLEDLKNAKEKITYTIDFQLTKDDKGNWNVNNLDSEQTNKLLGIY